jgi:hypothetical protein
MNGKSRMCGSMLKVLAFGWVILGALAAQAADFSVGRVEVEFAEEGWKEVPLPDTASAYGGDKTGALTVQSKLYVRGAPGGDDQMLVLVSAHSEGMGGGRGAYMSYSPNCRSDAQIFREGNEGFRASFMQCLMVTPLYDSESVFKALAPQILDLQTSGEVSVQRPVYTVWSHHAISTGSFLDVRVFVMSPMEAAGALVAETLPNGVLPEQVAWGRQLKDAVKSSVHSLSGRLTVPPIRRAPSVQNTHVGGG